MTVAPAQDHLMAESPLSKTIGRKLKIVPVTNMPSTRSSTDNTITPPVHYHGLLETLDIDPEKQDETK